MVARPEVSDVDAAYAAGLIDGEGCIHIVNAMEKNGNGRGRNQRVRLRISVGMQDKNEVLERMRGLFGGVIAKKWNSTCSMWHTNGRVAYNVLKTISKYCIVKKQEVSCAIEFFEFVEASRTGTVPQFSAESRSEFQRYKKRLSELKHYIPAWT